MKGMKIAKVKIKGMRIEIEATVATSVSDNFFPKNMLNKNPTMGSKGISQA